jgi:hypothetical protein
LSNGYGRGILTAKAKKNEEPPPDLLLIKIGVVNCKVGQNRFCFPMMGPSEEGGSFLFAHISTGFAF